MNSKIESVRKQLTGKITDAVLKQNGCIGTYYQNLGGRFVVGQPEGQYDDKLFVVYHEPGSILAARHSVAELFIHPQAAILMCKLYLSSGSIDTPVCNITVESLEQVYQWLVNHHFIIAEEEKDILYCSECGNTNVECLAWVKPNENNEFCDYSGGQNDDKEDNYCNDCEEHTQLLTQDELLDKIDEWAIEHSDFDNMEIIFNLRQSDFNPEDGSQDFIDECDYIWHNISPEARIGIWQKKKELVH